MNILFITNIYPTNIDPHRGIFIYQLIQQLCKNGEKVKVISPINDFKQYFKSKKKPININDLATVYYPYFFSFSDKIILNRFSTYKLTLFSFTYAISKGIKRHKITPDIIYSHFLFSAFSVLRLKEKLKRPLVTAVGESNLLYYEKHFSRGKIIQKLKNIDGFISVSSENRMHLINRFKVPDEKIIVLPNGVDTDLFYPRNKIKMRKKYNLPLEKKLLVFTGHFNERKGAQRVLEAIKKIKNIGIIFIGSGELLKDDKIVFIGKIPHEQVPELLSAADIFILPTLAEGSCNAVVEAMACGLPIISSNIPSIKEQLKEDEAILVDPLNVSQITVGITRLLEDDNLRNKLSSISIQKSNEFSLTKRAVKIKNWLIKIIKNDQ